MEDLETVCWRRWMWRRRVRRTVSVSRIVMVVREGKERSVVLVNVLWRMVLLRFRMRVLPL